MRSTHATTEQIAVSFLLGGVLFSFITALIFLASPAEYPEPTTQVIRQELSLESTEYGKALLDSHKRLMEETDRFCPIYVGEKKCTTRACDVDIRGSCFKCVLTEQ